MSSLRALGGLAIVLAQLGLIAGPTSGASTIDRGPTREIQVETLIDSRVAEHPLRLIASVVSESAEARAAWSTTKLLSESPAEAVALRVPLDESVELRVESLEGEDAVWSTSAVVRPVDAEAALQVFPSATVVGRLDEGIALGSITATVLGVTTPCVVDSSRFTCRVPAVPVDLRLGSDGTVPRYFWQLEAEPGEAIELGTVTLRPGASVSGRVIPRPGAVSRVQVTAERAMRGWRGDPATRRTMDALRTTVEADERGFFQLGPLGLGEVTLVAEQEGSLPTRVESIVLDEAREVRLTEPIELRAPLDVDLVLDPPTAPDGTQWLVTLSSVPDDSPVLETVSESPATLGGFVRAEGLAPGDYRLEVSTSDRSRWLAEDLEIDPTTSFVALAIPHVAIEGRLVRGDEGVSATLVFGTTQGALRVAVESDEDGRFESFLPREGSWPIELLDDDEQVTAALSPVVVELGPGGTAAKLLIAIPDTSVRGRVVDSDGEPVPDAAVLALRLGDTKRRESMVEVDEDGRFTLIGLEPGEIRLQAYDRDRTSTWRTIEVESGDHASDDVEGLELVLEAKNRIAGTVSARGYPVPGTQIFVRPEGVGVAGVQRLVTGPGGRFEVSVEPSATALTLLVDAPGFGLGLRRVPTSGGGPIRIRASTETGTLRVVGDTVSLASDATLRARGAEVRIGMLVVLLERDGRLRRTPTGITLTGLEPGVYSVCRSMPVTTCSSVQVVPATETVLQLDEERAEQ